MVHLSTALWSWPHGEAALLPLAASGTLELHGPGEQVRVVLACPGVAWVEHLEAWVVLRVVWEPVLLLLPQQQNQLVEQRLHQNLHPLLTTSIKNRKIKWFLCRTVCYTHFFM